MYQIRADIRSVSGTKTLIRTDRSSWLLIAGAVALLMGGCPTDNLRFVNDNDDNTNATPNTGENPGTDPNLAQPPADSGPRIAVQFESNVLAGAVVVLDASASTDVDGDTVSFFWQQTGGLDVVLSSTSTPVVTFIAPQVLVAETLTFRLRVSDGGKQVERTLSIVVSPGPFEGARTSWVADSEQMNADIDWRLPSHARLEVSRSHWSLSGVESIAVNPSVLPNGRHDIIYSLSGAGRTGAIAFAMKLFSFDFAVNARLAGEKFRVIAIDVLDGVAVPLFNGWLAAEETGAGSITGRYDVEILGAWRDADAGDVHTDLHLWLPNRNWADVDRAGWAPQGLERIVLARGTTLADGNYTIISEIHGQGRTANVAFYYKLLNFGFNTRQTMLGDQRRIIGLDVRNGVANVIFNGWLPAGEPGSGGLTSERKLQVVGAWRDGSNDVHIDVHVQMPDGSFLGKRDGGWARQGYEHIFLDEAALPDGIYRFSMTLNGSGQTGRVTYRAKLLNWQFERTEVMLGGTQREFQVQVANGVVIQVISNW